MTPEERWVEMSVSVTLRDPDTGRLFAGREVASVSFKPIYIEGPSYDDGYISIKAPDELSYVEIDLGDPPPPAGIWDMKITDKDTCTYARVCTVGYGIVRTLKTLSPHTGTECHYVIKKNVPVKDRWWT